jgi:CheY-like chemotaxis protein
VFELFVQENGSTLSSESGLGIGLTLARTLAELHGGTLRAESAGRGQGSRFTLRLPLRVESRLAPPAAIDERTPELNPACVLVVDDNRDSADSMAGLLRLLGHDAKVAYDGDMALKLAAAIHPEVVLLDLNMPHVDGFDVMKRLKALPRRAPHGVIAAMTGYGQESDRLKTLEAGFDAHLTKPVGVEQLQSLIASARQPAR